MPGLVPRGARHRPPTFPDDPTGGFARPKNGLTPGTRQNVRRDAQFMRDRTTGWRRAGLMDSTEQSETAPGLRHRARKDARVA
ncbi:hypothetical protein GCM10025873_15520 [Demequina sediminis]|nr:hypothetical protein GCM10025873_15520 [Demequina sediminis]